MISFNENYENSGYFYQDCTEIITCLLQLHYYNYWMINIIKINNFTWSPRSVAQQIFQGLAKYEAYHIDHK